MTNRERADKWPRGRYGEVPVRRHVRRTSRHVGPVREHLRRNGPLPSGPGDEFRVSDLLHAAVKEELARLNDVDEYETHPIDVGFSPDPVVPGVYRFDAYFEDAGPGRGRATVIARARTIRDVRLIGAELGKQLQGILSDPSGIQS